MKEVVKVYTEDEEIPYCIYDYQKFYNGDEIPLGAKNVGHNNYLVFFYLYKIIAGLEGVKFAYYRAY